MRANWATNWARDRKIVLVGTQGYGIAQNNNPKTQFEEGKPWETFAPWSGPGGFSLLWSYDTEAEALASIARIEKEKELEAQAENQRQQRLKNDPPVFVKPTGIAARIIDFMGGDNDCRFPVSSNQLTLLEAGIATMQAAGCKFTEEEVEILAAGEQTEQQTLVDRYNGQQVNQALDSIFNREDVL